MKKLHLLLLLPLFITCEKEVQEPTQFRLSPDAKIRIEAVKSGMQRVVSDSVDIDSIEIDTIHLTPLEVVKQAEFMIFNYEDEYGYHDEKATVGFAGKDTISENPALLRWSSEIMGDTTGYGDYSIRWSALKGRDYVIVKGDNIDNLDTLAYIPNSYIIDATENIINALANKDTSLIYSIHKDAFRFIPITGAEYKELKKKGLQ